MARRDGPAPASGRGDATFTEDGCPVEVYAALPSDDEAEVVHAALPAGASVLELGCGTGRIAEPLAALGHRVVGVDSSAAMLSHLRRVSPVQARIEDLALNDRFDGVLLASTLVNTEDPRRRTAFLRTARQHLAPDGLVIMQRHRPGWPLQEGSWSAGPVRLELRNVTDHGGGPFSATLVHRLGTRVAEQDFTTQVLDDAALSALLTTAGLQMRGVLTPDQRWVTAAVVPDRS